MRHKIVNKNDCWFGIFIILLSIFFGYISILGIIVQIKYIFILGAVASPFVLVAGIGLVRKSIK